jgi:hypothetical protein
VGSGLVEAVRRRNLCAGLRRAEEEVLEVGVDRLGSLRNSVSCEDEVVGYTQVIANRILFVWNHT